MELSEAVQKAAEQSVMPLLSMAMTPSGPKISDLMHEGSHNYEYLQELRPLMTKWTTSVGKAVRDKCVELGEFDDRPNFEVTDEYKEWIVDQLDVVYQTTGVDIACGIFALGYLLGDPTWDKQTHDRKTFHSALADRDTQQLLALRFRQEMFLRDRFFDLIKTGAEVISAAFNQMSIPHNEENVQEWGRLSVLICFYEAFQVGLRSRRIWEEDMTFDQIARGLED